MLESERLGVAAEMAAGVAHTVNNNLMVISGNIEALTRYIPPDRQRQMENIRSGVRRISDLTTRLLAFTEAGVEFPSSADLNDIVRHALAQEGPFPPDVRLDMNLDSAPIEVHGVFARLNSAVRSALSNAREAIHGPGTIRVSTACDALRGSVCIQDDGEGIAPEIQRRLFTPFVTTKSHGRGLGGWPLPVPSSSPTAAGWE
jgi:signal transduction histidine kinase